MGGMMYLPANGRPVQAGRRFTIKKPRRVAGFYCLRLPGPFIALYSTFSCDVLAWVWHRPN